MQNVFVVPKVFVVLLRAFKVLQVVQVLWWVLQWFAKLSAVVRKLCCLAVRIKGLTALSGLCGICGGL